MPEEPTITDLKIAQEVLIEFYKEQPLSNTVFQFQKWLLLKIRKEEKKEQCE